MFSVFRQWRYLSFAAILLLALVHGLLYFILVPPWQHYDEPTQFEYAWLLANRPGLPKPGDYDQSMRRAVALSMLEHHFFDELSWRPDLSAENVPIEIGLSQLNHPPLYYLVASLPLRVFKSSDVTFQLYTARAVSLCLYLLTIGIGYSIAGEILPEKHPLRWMVPLTMAMLPGLVDLMTSVNSDVGATTAFSFFLWGSVRIMRRGFSPLRAMWVFGGAAICFVTKNTVMIAVPLVIVPLVFSIFRDSRKWIAWGLLFGGGALGCLLLFSWGDALLWYRQTVQNAPTRSERTEAPLGNYAIRLDSPPALAQSSQTFQILPLADARALRGKSFILGAWVWASEPVHTNGMMLFDGNLIYREIEANTIPQFFSFSGRVSSTTNLLRVILESGKKENVSVFYDGLVLVEGEWPQDESPKFDDSGAERGVWGGRAFTNLLRNASAESAGPFVSPAFENLVEKTIGKYLYFTTRTSLVLGSLLDFQSSSWYYEITGKNLLRTFWAKMGWGNVSLPASAYWLLGGVTVAGLVGAVLYLLIENKTLSLDMLFFMGLILLGVWGITIARGLQSLVVDVFIPSARYAYPAIVPTVLVLNMGWLQFSRLLTLCIRLSLKMCVIGYLGLFTLLDALAILILFQFYSGR